MENTKPFNPNFAITSLGVQLIEKVHRCADCPIRKMAVKRPHSLFARIHGWHRTWWPAWKAHQMRTCAQAAKVNAQA